MTTIRTDDPRDLLPSEYEDPWPPSDAEIEMMQWLQDQEDLDKDRAKRSRAQSKPQITTCLVSLLKLKPRRP